MLRELDKPRINHYLSRVIERERGERLKSKTEGEEEAGKEDLESHGNELFLRPRGSHSNGRSYKYIQGVSPISATRYALGDPEVMGRERKWKDISTGLSTLCFNLR